MGLASRRRFLSSALTIALAPSGALAQAPARPAGAVWRIGYLSTLSVDNDQPLLAAFRDGMKELGYVEGASFVIEPRNADGRTERLPALAAELARLRIDVLVVYGTQAAHAAKQALGATPIVMANVLDPVGDGLVASLARPGANITGLSDFHFATATKRLELLREAVPAASRVAVLLNPANASNVRQLKDLQAAAPALGAVLLPLEVRRPDDVAPSFASIGRERAGALLILGDAVLTSQQRRIAELALRQRVPAIYTVRAFAEAGGLMSYGTSFANQYRRAAVFVDKILKGAAPGQLPIEQPTKFDLVVNLKTARALGIKIPQAVLARADHVIE